MKHFRLTIALCLALLLPAATVAETTTLPFGTVVYGYLAEKVRSKKKETSEGDLVRAYAWRDVIVDGRTVIKAGAPMMVKVAKLKKAKFAGIKGKLELEALEVETVDGNKVALSGGYDKSGKGRKALSISLAALVVWPAIFIKGKQAVLEEGTVFDAMVAQEREIDVPSDSPRKITIAKDLEVEVLYDDMDPEGKSKILPVTIKRCEGEMESAEVVTVNEQEITPIGVDIAALVEDSGCVTADASIDLEALAEHFTKGINRFEIEVEGERAEVILDIEM